MDALKRRIFFWTLVILFFLTAPIVVLHARGYRFDTTRGVFVYSGTITFKSNPQTVTVSINDKVNDSQKLNRINNSYNITGLIPGEYEVKITAPGFNTWSKKTDIHSGLASEFWNVILTKKDYEKTDLNLNNINKFYTSPNNKYIAYAKNGDNLEIGIYNISNEKVDNNFSFTGWQLIQDTDRKENIEWSPKEDFLSIPVEKTIVTQVKPKTRFTPPSTEKTTEFNYYIVDPNNNTTIDLNEFLGMKNVSDVRWDPQEKGYLFFLSEGTLYRVNVTDKNTLVKIAGDIWAFDLSHSNVYYIQKANNLIFQSSLDGQGGKNQITTTFPSDKDTAIAKMIVYDEHRIALISQDKNLYIFNQGDHDNYFKKLGEQVEGVSFSDDGKKMLFWTNYEISTYFLRDWEVQPVRSENEVANITRYSTPINNVEWFKDYEHVIFNSGRWVKIIELDPRDHRNCLDIINTQIESPFIRYNNYLERLYYTDSPSEGTNDIHYIKFPESVPFLGIGG